MGFFMQQYNFESLSHIDRFRLTVKRMSLGKSRSLNFHDHDFSEIAVVLAASDTLHLCGGKTFQLAVGDVIVLHPGIVHAYENTSGFEVVNIIYDAAQLPLPELDGGNLKFFQAMVDTNYLPQEPEKPFLHLAEKDLQKVVTFIERMEEEIASDLPGNRLCLFGLFLSLLTFIARSGGVAEQEHFAGSAVRGLHYINLHFKENISVDFLARLCGMSRSGFFTAFRKLSGYTPIEYQKAKRLALALKLLRSTNKSLSEIASECGFCDSNYLSKLFTRKYGISPRELRKNSANSKKNGG
jgi:AraC-like DNA-binding protein/quercetin dioxygenase-like cupin family protein